MAHTFSGTSHMPCGSCGMLDHTGKGHIPVLLLHGEKHVLCATVVISAATAVTVILNRFELVITMRASLSLNDYIKLSGIRFNRCSGSN